MSNTPLVSVIIPAYKAAAYIEETINGVLNQTHQHFELIVVNDGSPDNQDEFIQPFADADPRVQYIKQPNSGVSVARNKGFSHSKGELVAFLDADDVWLPQNLEKKVALFAQEEALGLVHSDLAVIDSNSQLTGATKSGKEGHILEDLLAWNGTCVPTPSSILVRREVVEKVGGFDPQLSNAADQEFFFRVANAYKIGRVPEVTWHYRVHDNNMHSNVAVMERDALLAYQRAEEHNLFKSKAFRNQCFATMYWIVGASWWGDGNNKAKGLQYLLKAARTHPSTVLGLLRQKLFS
jgi:glycosyltransferase involved in cell wall biosynthesis